MNAAKKKTVLSPRLLQGVRQMTPVFYFAVWIDFLHGPLRGKIAINLQEVNAEDQIKQTHRKHIETAQPPTEAEIVEMLLPGAVLNERFK